MLYGTGTVMSVWVLGVWLPLRRSGTELPLVWPALLLAAVVAWSQAVVWTPFPVRWVRVAATALLLAGAVLFVPVGLTYLGQDGLIRRWRRVCCWLWPTGPVGPASCGLAAGKGWTPRRARGCLLSLAG